MREIAWRTTATGKKFSFLFTGVTDRGGGHREDRMWLRASFAALLSTAAALTTHPALRQPTCASATHTQCRTAMAAPTMLISLTPRGTATCQHAASPMRRLEPLRMQEAPFWENGERVHRTLRCHTLS